jgi:hypothetical protein
MACNYDRNQLARLNTPSLGYSSTSLLYPINQLNIPSQPFFELNFSYIAILIILPKKHLIFTPENGKKVF